MSDAQRSILHVDMDAFYASVEQRDDPSLRGLPLIVGGGSNRGVVAAASYEARRYGIRSAMPVREALRRCPDLRQVRPRMAHYKAVSDQVFEIFHHYTPVVEGLSLDEAFLDVTASRTLYGDAPAIARQVKDAILEATGLTASVGVAPNKLVAKIASDLDKPDGLVVVTPDNLRATLDPLPVSVIPGIGRRMLERLARTGIETIADLRTAPERELEALFGRYAQRTRERASGIDERPVVSARGAKSVSAEETFDQDLASVPDMQRELLRLTERVALRLRRKDLQAGTVHVKIRQPDFTTFTRQRSLHPPSHDTRTLYECGLDLLRTWLAEHPGARLRLLGIGTSDFAGAGQGDLFADAGPGANASLDKAADEIRERFGDSAVSRARGLKGS